MGSTFSRPPPSAASPPAPETSSRATRTTASRSPAASASAIRGNSIFGNGDLGIDLGDNGRSPNDLTDSDAGPNLTQNFPVLIAAAISGGDLFVTYSVNSDPGNSAYPLTIDFYESDLLGQGRVYLGTNSYSAADFTLGAKTVNLGNAGVLGVVQPEPLVAVATDAGANSSEFSDPRLVGIAGATTFTVNSTNDIDDGLCDLTHCSLREAILFANLNSGAADTVAFNIPGSPPFSIAPVSALPAIADPATLDATTQPGFAGAPIVELNGTNAGGTPGLRVLSAANVTLRGLAINRFNSGGIQIASSPSAIVVGNYIGTDIAGAVAQANGSFGVSIGAGSPNALIGGSSPADRNLISGNSSRGVWIQSAANVVIRGNRIGTNAAGTAALSNNNGIEANSATGLVIGGTTPGEGNLISGNLRGLLLDFTVSATVQGNLIGTTATGTGNLGNGFQGIESSYSSGLTLGGPALGAENVVAFSGNYGVYLLYPSGGTIQGNFVGVAADGVSPMPNGLGIALYGGSGVLVGGAGAGERNVIARNSDRGVAVANNGIQHAIRRNSMFDNGGLGIDLEWDGFTPNDPLDVDAGSNRRQNFPQFQSVTITGGDLIVTYLVDSAPVNATYPLAVDFFKPDSVASFEGKTFVAGDSYTAADFTLGAKTVNLGNAVALGVAVGSRLVGMATDAAGNSSEFAQTFGVTGPPQTFVVNTTDDLNDGACDVTHCSLREAIDACDHQRAGGRQHSLQHSGCAAVRDPAAESSCRTSATRRSSTRPRSRGSPAAQSSSSLALRPAATVCGSPPPGSTVRGFVVRNWSGIGIYDFAGNATIAGNFVGTDVTGTIAQANNTGVFTNGSGTLVGGATAADRNLISGNNIGLVLYSGAFARGNWIGLNATGGAALANGSGVSVQDATLGGTGAGETNVVSGNSGVGVTVYGSASLVQGNLIGTNPAGSAMVGNGGHGIATFASGGTIGGPLPGAGNLVSGNGGSGVVLSGSSGLTIQGNWIGLDAAGTLDFGNAQSGVRVEAGSSLQQLIDNIISGNANGVRIEAGASAIVLTGNRIGTNAAGSGAVGNSGIGVEVLDSPLVQIGAGGQGNLISGNGGRGVRISGGASAGAIVRGNFIGTDSTGGADLGNASDGIEVVDVGGVQIGGAAPGDGNLISGNNLRGVVLSGSNTTGALVMGNLIGTNFSGTAAVPNSGAGIEVNAAPGNFIGGAGAGQRNLISGNGSIGIYVNGSNATGNVIAGNLIGTDVLGLLAVGNGSSGVDISSAPANLIGGTTPGAGNLISGNGGIGVSISFSGATANQVQGNWIGTNLSATGAIGNAADGVQIFAAPGNTIGGATLGAGNVISGNTLSGVSLNFSGAAGNFVYGNLIGTQGNGTTPLPNGLSGVTVAFNASSNRIGGPAPGQGNVIAGNTDDGITVESGVNDRLSGNSYFGNGGLAIDLGPDGVQPPDVGDGDSGANLLQNYPYLAAVSSDGATTTSIAGSLSSTANATFTVELYASAGCDPSGHGEGTTYLGSTSILADASGAAAFLISLPVAVANGATVTGIAITAAGSSSEFGPCIFEDDLAIFTDGFEMGDTSAWAPAPALRPERSTRGRTALVARGLGAQRWSRLVASGSSEVRVRAFDGELVPLSAEMEVSEGQLRPGVPRLASQGDGRVGVAYLDTIFEPPAYQIRFRVLNADGVPLGPSVLVNEGPLCAFCDAWFQDVATNWDGDFVVVWQEEQPLDGSGTGVFGRRFSRDGAPLGPAFGLAQNTLGDQLTPTVTMDAAGNFVAVWMGAGVESFDVLARRFDRDGNPLGPEFIVNELTYDVQAFPDVSGDMLGNWVATWQAFNLPVDAYREIWGRAYRSDGTPVGPDFHVNPDPVDDFTEDREEKVSLSEAGTFTVTWTTLFPDDRFDEVRAAHFVLPCVPDESTACLQEGRFLVRALWHAPSRGYGVAQVKRVSSETAAFTFFSEDSIEVVVKVLDGCGLNGRYWVFAAGLTDVEVTLIVTDTVTGRVWSNVNPLGALHPAVLDTEAHAGCGASLEASHSVERPARLGGGAFVLLPAGDPCAETGTCLSLASGRYTMGVNFAGPNGIGGSGRALPLGDASGAFWFFSDQNLEIVVKVIDVCATLDQFWFYAAGLTNLEVEIWVVDTLSGSTRTFRSPYGTPFEPIREAFQVSSCEPAH